ncbi:hypothetical protein L198_07778 [Cryptococcus wingfieldii CBS 7118]|uniref:Uncharacterized protein n=1 Tax=Cryptococcus wingfieldii CBS 7118 TaxID=1295528 RepID=A0A1E3HY91_9TREE|nr:hypothetical protein L198_07778 [Cryptococcus wingfieldii CBS 7118]ODN81294.1 hypothetical protein L198_07778 [Cryptococcus wingfieldii CBS 7118]
MTMSSCPWPTLVLPLLAQRLPFPQRAFGGPLLNVLAQDVRARACVQECGGCTGGRARTIGTSCPGGRRTFRGIRGDHWLGIAVCSDGLWVYFGKVWTTERAGFDSSDVDKNGKIEEESSFCSSTSWIIVALLAAPDVVLCGPSPIGCCAKLGKLVHTPDVEGIGIELPLTTGSSLGSVRIGGVGGDNADDDAREDGRPEATTMLRALEKSRSLTTASLSGQGLVVCSDGPSVVWSGRGLE